MRTDSLLTSEQIADIVLIQLALFILELTFLLNQ
jgi:hypothetical protein